MIKKTYHILILIASILIIFYFLGCLFVFIKGKEILSSQLNKLLGEKTVIDQVILVPPFSFVIKNVSVENIGFVSKIVAEPSLSGLLIGKTIFNVLSFDEPNFFLRRFDTKRFNFDSLVEHIKAELFFSNVKNRRVFFVKRLIVNRGSISFKDDYINVSFRILPVNVNIATNLFLKTTFLLQTKIFSDSQKEVVNFLAQGWLNWPKKDLKGSIICESKDLSFFSPYLRRLLATDVISGNLLFRTDLNSENNNLIADCHLEINNVSFGNEPFSFSFDNKDSALLSIPLVIIKNTLLKSGNSGTFDFTINTKLDAPRFEGISFKGDIFPRIIEKNLKGASNISPQTIKSLKQDLKQISKELKDGFGEVINELKSKVKTTQPYFSDNLQVSQEEIDKEKIGQQILDQQQAVQSQVPSAGQAEQQIQGQADKSDKSNEDSTNQSSD